jgi:hypothetical protein
VRRGLGVKLLVRLLLVDSKLRSGELHKGSPLTFEEKGITVTDAKPKPDPKPLTTEYHKAHKQLMLWSAILFIWELIGIDLEKAKEAGGNVGAIIGAIKSPQAVPWALMILVAYFLFKTTVEWYQCSSQRRLLRVAKIDFRTAWIVPIIAYALYAYQAVKKVQFADVVQKERSAVIWVEVGVILGLIFGIVITARVRESEEYIDLKHWRWTTSDTFAVVRFGISFILTTITGVLAVRWFVGWISWRELSVGFLLASLLTAAVRLFFRRVWPLARDSTLGRVFSKQSRTEK